MKPFLKTDFPRAIIHIDGDGFFAGCEIAKNPKLQGKPVVVGRERGIALAMNYEAKRLGVTRGMHIAEARRIAPNAIFCDMDHESYKLFSLRMNNIIERFTPIIDRYSIDESFADITGLRSPLGMSYEEIAHTIKETLKKELGMTFSIGLAPTKVLAKLGSNYKKPDGMTVIKGGDIHHFLHDMPIEKIWGIGKQTSAHMHTLGIHTALEFAVKEKAWVEEKFAKPYQEIWKELQGEYTLPLHTKTHTPEHSLMRTRTFSPIKDNPQFLLAELSRHAEVVCARAREHHLQGKQFSVFLKTQEFQFHSFTCDLFYETNIPQEIFATIQGKFSSIYKSKTTYRASGVTLSKLQTSQVTQLDLFAYITERNKFTHLYESIDVVNTRFGKSLLHIASSTHLFHKKQKMNVLGNSNPFTRIGIPYMGQI